MKQGTVFAIVDFPGKPIERDLVLTYQQKQLIQDGTTIPEVSDSISATNQGLYFIGTEDHPYYKYRMKAFLAKMEKVNVGKYPKLLGPFEDDDPEDIAGDKGRSAAENALIAVINARPKTDKEELIAAKAKHEAEKAALAQEKEKAEKELEELKAELAKRKKADKKSEPVKKDKDAGDDKEK